ncbi:MAG TPA: extracellular solute-binding protein [Chloroflexota bacterium]|nr:extracellular solute-binding protein [Chloroflexota bacterium]
MQTVSTSKITRRRFVRQSAFAATATAAGAAVAACEIGGQSQATQTVASSGRVEFWQIYQNSPAVPQVKELIDRKHPQLQVEFVDVPGGQMAEKLTVASAGGTPPDSVFINAPFFHDCARLFQPLDKFLKRDAKLIDSSDWLPQGLQSSTIKGNVYGLPLETAVRVWWFNKDIFNERGIPLPTRQGAPKKFGYKELEEMAQQMTFQRGDRQVYGMYVLRNWFNVLIYVYGAGGTYVDADHTKCFLDSPEAVAGIQYAFDLVDRRRVAPASGGLGNYEAENTVAMMYNNAARAQNLRREEYGKLWDVGPVVQGQKAPMSFAFVHHAGVVKESANPGGAWTAITEYTGKDANPLWMAGHGWPTVRKSYLETWVKEGEAPPDTPQNVVEWIKVSPIVTFPAGSSGIINPLASKILNEAIEGKRSVKDAAGAMAREITAVLQSNAA